MDVLELIGRDRLLFASDLARSERHLADSIADSSFLVIGGAGSIGRAVVREIFRRDPRRLHVVDISENSLVEVVRDLRSTLGYGSGEFATFAIDAGSRQLEALFHQSAGYDFVLNLSALKHVRSERDPFTLMRMIEVNVIDSLRAFELARTHGARGYFCVSTDKAANPTSMMGATKLIMELALRGQDAGLPVTMARMANVAFSDGSLLHGFDQRMNKRQPLSAPSDVRRYFLTEREAGELCLMAALLGEHGQIFFPRLDSSLHLASFAEIAVRYLAARGYAAHLCESEQQARDGVSGLITQGRWPCYFFSSDTSGEKTVEQLFTAEERPDFSRFDAIGVLNNQGVRDISLLDDFLEQIARIKSQPTWTKADLAAAFKQILPDFSHLETGRNLDDRM